MVRFYEGSPVAGAAVKIEGEQISASVTTDAQGLYETDLPAGLYTMTVSGPPMVKVQYLRPLFRVSSNISMNINFVSMSSCDLAIVDGHFPTGEDARNACEGTDLYSIPDQHSLAFQLSIQYGTRRPNDARFEYSCRWNPRDSKGCVFVAYNLFTLLADHVVYDSRARTLLATGNVVLERTDGTKQNADSMTFHLENGEAVPMP
jgi:hypothetical protein